MDDAGIRRHDLESSERFLRPAQQRVPLAVALELEVGIDLEGARRSELVHDHRMVDHELGGQLWIHAFGVAAHLHHRVAHRREVHDRRHAREILEQYARRHERDFLIRYLERLPAGQLFNVVGANHAAVFEP